jgi:2-methylisocitrate lyase-like PEP mutase family enzyme
LPSPDAYARAFAIERIKAAVSAARALPNDFVLTARADGIMTGAYYI